MKDDNSEAMTRLDYVESMDSRAGLVWCNELVWLWSVVTSSADDTRSCASWLTSTGAPQPGPLVVSHAMKPSQKRLRALRCPGYGVVIPRCPRLQCLDFFLGFQQMSRLLVVEFSDADGLFVKAKFVYFIATVMSLWPSRGAAGSHP